MNTWIKQLALAASMAGTVASNAAAALAAQACTGKSPAHTVALVELYTSEGCDSCPPADKFVSGLRAEGVAPDKAVLLSLHVDYWNYIGWKDIFSRPIFTERQRGLAALVRTRTIYTPEMFIGARELRSDKWDGGVQEAVQRINARPAKADIAISLGAAGPEGLPVDVKASSAGGGKLHVALVESNIDRQIRAGENKGRLLHHDFVVREWLAPLALDGKGTAFSAAMMRTVPLPAGTHLKNLSVSAFVQNDSGDIVQAFNLPLCGS
jgi:hypothetical protein